VRNSSLVEWGGTENVTGLKIRTEAAAREDTRVGERRPGGEGVEGSALERGRVRMPV